MHLVTSSDANDLLAPHVVMDSYGCMSACRSNLGQMLGYYQVFMMFLDNGVRFYVVELVWI